MKLSDYEGFAGKVPFLIKFTSKKRFVDDLKSGKLFMNNFKFFVDREKEEQKKGMGDNLEVAQVINATDIQLICYETSEKFIGFEKARIVTRPDYLLNKPLFCMTYVDASSFEVIEEKENSVKAHLVFTEEQKMRFPEDFGEYALIMPFGRFFKMFSSIFDKENIEFIADKVRYDDYSINNAQRIKAHLEQSTDLFFWKDSSLKYQSEYRIVLLNKDIGEPLIINIGDITKLSHYMSTKDLLDGKFGLELNFK
ncbi:hypothetical protein P4S95_09355 [Aneurinibacillus aneurinilyticus]|uniref:hypothetical protein n=1 Tax=Aneurinibacillus aneurinilyticus TaxID=1391 RepID=UPI002E1AA14E|nr:hypothetical protein [Aneurinibacillus aneurinilyticus]